MFALPVLVLPVVFGLAIYRLYQVPRKLLLGELRPPAERRFFWSVAGAVAYSTLLGHTVFLAASLVRLFVGGGDRLLGHVSLLVHVVAFPAVYIAAAWVFYYALVPMEPRGTRGAPAQHEH